MLKTGTKKITSLVTLFALATSLFCLAFSPVDIDASNETVYCPLTKKLQPVKAPKKEPSQNPLEEVCAADKNKKSFVNEIFGKNLLRANFLDKKQFENLVFDFFQKGKSAFANLPQFPDSPRKDSVKPSSTVIGFGKNDETRFVWKTQIENFNFAQNPRPPNAISTHLFESQNFRKLELISRRISPRAPPFSS